METKAEFSTVLFFKARKSALIVIFIPVAESAPVDGMSEPEELPCIKGKIGQTF